MKLDFEWCNGGYCQPRLYDFLCSIDNIIIPKLSARVNIKDYSKKLSINAENLFVINDDTDVASCSIYTNTRSAYISSIAVKREYHLNGVGSVMLEEVCSHVRHRCDLIYLEVNVDNSNAIKFYKKNGFISVGYDKNWISMAKHEI